MDASIEGTPERPGEGSAAARRALVAAVAMGVVADLLFLDREPGLSLLPFGVALLAAAALVRDGRRLGDPVAWGLVALAVVPVVELVQPLSVLAYLLLGAAALARVGLGGGAAGAVGRAMRRMVLAYPLRLVLAPFEVGAALTPPEGLGARGASVVRRAMLPAGAALILLVLLSAANPVLELWLARLAEGVSAPEAVLRHGAMVTGAALVLWPLLAHLPREAGPGAGWAAPRRPGWLDAGAVGSTLLVLNLLMGVQTALDAGVLWGGMALPEGVTHAEYAHRGAYPLVATALLAGLFALVSRPLAAGRPGLRALLLLWIGQNLMLVVSSMLRLELYVEEWGLTHLRLAAAVWMALVAGGLALTAWQALRDRSNGWLLARVALMAAVVLYGCTLVSGGGIVARANVARFEATGRLDLDHLCGLGPAAWPAVADHHAATGDWLCAPRGLRATAPADWREWGFRQWRLAAYEGRARGPVEADG